MNLHIQIKNFEGPLSLLLYLIQREEMNIFDIPIHHMTREYLKSLKMMENLNLEIAGEFIAMAATLIHIKSEMLLPKEERQTEDVEEDPRQSLMDLLLEYKKYKKASEDLYARNLLEREVWKVGEGKAQGLFEEEEKEESSLLLEELEERGLFLLASSYKKLKSKKPSPWHPMISKWPSVISCILEMKKDFLPGKMTPLQDFIKQEKQEKQETLVLMTFLSVLELVRMGLMSVLQSQNFSDIYIEVKKEIREKDLKDISVDQGSWASEVAQL